MAETPAPDATPKLLAEHLREKSRQWDLITIAITIVIIVILLWSTITIFQDVLELSRPWDILAAGLFVGIVVGLAQLQYHALRMRQLHSDPLIWRAPECIVKVGNATSVKASRDNVLDVLFTEIDKLFQPDYIEVAHPRNGAEVFYVEQADLSLPHDDPLVSWLFEQPAGVPIDMPAELPPEAQATQVRMRERGVAVIIPMGRQGWFALGDPASGDGYPDLAKNILQRLAHAAILGLERTEIIENQQKRANELEALYWIAQAVNFAMPLDDILELIYTQLRRVIAMPNLFIALKEETTGKLSFSFYVEEDERIYRDDAWSPNDGLTGHIIQNSMIIRTDDYLSECQRRGIEPVGRPRKAWMGAPLTAGDKSIGVMVASANAPDVKFTAEDESFFVTIAAYTASILERHNLYERLEARAHQLSTLNEIGQLLASSLDLEKVLSLVVRNAGKLLSAEAGALLLLDEGSGDLVFRVSIGGAGEKLIGEKVPSGKGIVGAAFADNQPVIVNKANEDQRWYDGVAKRTKYSTNSIIAVPLNARGRTIGVLELLNQKDGQAFSGEDAELLLAFGAQAAIAIENAQLFTQTDKQLQTRLEELTTMQQIDRQLNATLDYSQVMGQTLEWAIRITGAIIGIIAALQEEEDGTRGLRFLAHKGYPQDIFDHYAEEEIWPLTKGLIGHTVQTGETSLVEEVTYDSHYTITVPGMESQLTVPIKREGRVIGVMALESAHAESFTEENVALIERLADHAAIAIENARLFEQVRRANEAKTDFISFVSHELKQPMTSIRGYTDLLRKGIGGALNEQQLQFLSVIRSNVGRMDRLVSDLLDISRIESGRFRLEIGDVVPAELVSEAVQAYEQEISNKKQQLHVEIEPELPRVAGDRGRLLQVLTNLISNASKYTPEGGDITIGAAKHIDGEQAFVQWSVQDTGIGMSEEELNRLFTKYFRSNNPAVRSVPGTGLGLVITRSIIELHNGQIWVDSRPEEGSKFSFVIPIDQNHGS